MNALVWMLLLLALGGLGYVTVIRVCTWVDHRKRNKQNGGKSHASCHSRQFSRARKYPAVELKICNDPCEAGLGIVGKRILKSEAPVLPLHGCRYEKCKCNYAQYDDRRYLQRRDTPHDVPVNRARNDDRRRNRSGRRLSDQ